MPCLLTLCYSHFLQTGDSVIPVLQYYNYLNTIRTHLFTFLSIQSGVKLGHVQEVRAVCSVPICTCFVSYSFVYAAMFLFQNGADDVKKHRWFKTIDWEAVPQRKLKVRGLFKSVRALCCSLTNSSFQISVKTGPCNTQQVIFPF